MRKFLRGVSSPGSRRSPFAKGFVRKYALEDATTDFYEAEGASASAYQKAVWRALAAQTEQGMRYDLDHRGADGLKRLGNLCQITHREAQPGRTVGGAFVWQRVDLNHHVTHPPGMMTRPLAVLFLAKFDAERLIESQKAIHLASLEDKKVKRNVGHESAPFAPIRR